MSKTIIKIVPMKKYRVYITSGLIILSGFLSYSQIPGSCLDSPISTLNNKKIPEKNFDVDSYADFYRKHFNSSYFTEEFNSTLRLAGLSKTWAEAKWNFANFDLTNGINWDSLYYEFIPKAISEQSPAEYYKLLMNFYSYLKDGHSLIFAPDQLRDSIHADIPINCQLVDSKVVIVRNNGSSKTYERLQPGSVILEINDMNIHDYVGYHISPFFSFSTPHDSIARIFSYYLTRGPINETLKMKVKTTDGKIFTEFFSRQPNPDIYPHATGFSYTNLNGTTALLTINTFNDNSLVLFLDSIFQTTQHPGNLIIDLRRNGGGSSGNGFELLGWLTDSTFKSGLSVLRKYRPGNRSWGDQPDEIVLTDRKWDPKNRNIFKGKVVVLTGPDTYSAAEDFVLVFKHLKRGTTIGQVTGGSTGQPMMFQLPMGGMGAVCSKRELMVDSTEFIGKGIRPDIEVDYTLKGILSGNDEALQKALEILNK